MRLSNLTAFAAAGALSVFAFCAPRPAHAAEDPRWGRWIDAADPTARPFDLRLAVDVVRLPLADETFGSKPGRDYGFVRPSVTSIETQAGTFVRPHWFLGGAFAQSWGWGKQDGPSSGDTDAASIRATRSVSAFSFAIMNEGVLTFDRVTLRAGVTVGARLVLLTLDGVNQQTPPQRLDLFFRPRLVAELYVAAGFSLGAYGQTEGVDPRDWGAGGFLSWRINDIRPWGRL